MGSGAQGVVRELFEDRVTIEVGGIRLQLPREEVEPIQDRSGPTPEAGGAESPSAWSREPFEGGYRFEGGTEIDLRGLRVDEVELRLGRALDGAVVESLAEVRIIHGMGTGAVKARVQELLRSDGRIDVFRPGDHGEGGSGVTVAVLK